MLDDFFGSLFRDASDPLVLIGPDRRLVAVNRAFRTVAHRGGEGRDFMALVSAPARERVLSQLVRAAAGETVLVEVPHPRHGDDGGDTVVEYRFFPLDGGRVAGIGRVRDQEKALGERLGRTEAELRQKARLLDEIQMELTQVPFVDPVTGVWNRLQVIERLTGEWSRTERWGSPIACLMVDLEGVDLLRSRDGDAAADEALRAVARSVKSAVRNEDIVGRYGGARFVVIAVHCDAKGARQLAERITTLARAEPTLVAASAPVPHLRIGCCTNRSEGVEIMEDLFSVAEGALGTARARAEEVVCAEETAS